MIDRYTFFRSYYDSLRELPAEDFKSVLCAMCAYVFDETEPELTGFAKSVFLLIKPHLDKSVEIGEKRSAAGKAGAERKKEKQVESKSKQTVSKPKQTTIKVISEVPELDEAIRQFIQHRKQMKKPMTDHAVDLFVKRLDEMSDTVQGKISLINEAIRRGWMDVYPAKEEKKVEKTDDVVGDWLKRKEAV